MTDYEKTQLEKYLDQRFKKMEKQYKEKEKGTKKPPADWRGEILPTNVERLA